MLDKIYQVFPNRQLIIIGLGFFHLLLGIAYFISDSFTGTGFDESVVYFLHTGVDGFETSGYRYLFVSTVLLIFLCLYTCIKLGKISYFNNPVNVRKIVGINIALVTLLFFQPVMFTLVTQPLIDIAQGRETKTIELEIPGFIEIPRKKNIVYLYLESFERTFLDDTIFPGLAPNLKTLEQQGLAFTNIGEAYGSRWTIAGMVASQCGLPLQPMPNANKPGTFMPKAVCLGDTLKQNGYITSYLGGASSRFGGKGNFYQTHQFDTVTGLEDHLQNLPLGTSPYSHWGLSDESLFQLAWSEFSRLAAQSKPFAFFLLTLDTHPPHGYPSPICNDIPFGDGKSSLLNTYHCSDRLAGEFIHRLLASEVADETVIVVASDHMAMNNDVSSQLARSANRRNLFFILEKNGRRESIDRQASAFDLAPTLLSVLGAEVADYNLGVNLLEDNRTIMERIENPDRALRIWSNQLGELFYY